MSKNEMYCFMYSDEQVKEEKAVNLKIGRDFQCGEVSRGANKKKFSDLIKLTDMAGYYARFPDAEIVYKGIKNKTVYTMPKTPYLESGKE